MSEEGRDIAPVPKCRRPAERKKCEASFKYFCTRCFPRKFYLGFSPDHLKAIEKIDESVTQGMLFALAMPRGSGKTTLIVCAVIWAICCGHCRYVALIGPTAKHAKKLLRSIKGELRFNDTLFDLFPEATYPFRCLGGQANKCGGQLHAGDATCIEWGKEQIVFASIPNAACSGAVIEVAGITGSIRGMQYDTPDGETLRPDMVIVDDPQTKKSAKSQTQCDDRLETIQADILGLAGPDKSIAGFVLCTVIRLGDVADQLLDQEKHPEWCGERFQLIYAWPENEELWDKYAEIRREGGRAAAERATAFYKKNRKAMDKGAVVAWEDRKKRDEISALQGIYNLLLKDPDAFWCEYMNAPRDPNADSELLTAEQIAGKVHGYTRGIVPPAADTLTAFIDIQGKCLYWVVVAWRSADFSGWILDWGAWPDQKTQHFTLAQVRNTLAKKYPGRGTEGRVRSGLMDLLTHLLERKFETPAGVQHSIARVGVDCAWGMTSKTAQAVCREHDRAAQIMACFGKGISPKNAPIEAWPRKEGEKRGLRLIVRPNAAGGRHCLSDTNFYKTFIHMRFATAMGDPGSLSLPKPAPRRRNQNKMIAEHCRSEPRKHIKTEERSGDVWLDPTSDNHLWDCLVNCAVMASIEGVQLAEHRPTRPKKRKRRKGRGASQLAV